MIQARGLWADRGSALALTFLLLVSILCVMKEEPVSGDFDQAGAGYYFAAAWQQETGRTLDGEQEAVEEISNPMRVDAEDASSGGCASVLLWKNTSTRLLRTAVWLAGFLFMGKFLPFRAGGILSAFLHRETPDRARFLRELFIQKKKDGKKRRVF